MTGKTEAPELKYDSTTTLRRIRGGSPRSGRACEDGYSKLLKHLGKTKADDHPVSLLTVLDSNGLDDALWVLSYAMLDDRLARHFQAWCAEQVLHLFSSQRPDDNRVSDQIAMLRNDEATDDQRDAVWDAARAAVWDVARDAGGAARAASAAASAAAVWAAAGPAARAAAGAAGAAAWDAATDDQRDAVWDAARAAVWDAQERQLRKMIKSEKQDPLAALDAAIKAGKRDPENTDPYGANNGPVKYGG